MDLDLSLLAIADLAVVPFDRLAGQILAAVRGGATAVQLRGKEVASGELMAAAEELVPELAGLGLPLFINDRVDVAAIAGAAGVHLGDEDLGVAAARSLLGPAVWIGRTARSPEAARRAADEGADYVGAGTIYPGGTKPGIPVIGLDGLRTVAKASPVPVVAIGGIDAERAAACLMAGAAGVAVIGALFAGAPDEALVEARARRLRAAVEEGRRGRRG